MNKQMTLTLTGGVVMPMAGIGTFLLSPDEAEASCVSALAGGCRLIDTANAYVNERADAVEKTLERLDTGCIDLGKLKALFHIDRLMLAGGGQMNWSFAQEDLIDELSIILAPTADGNREAAPLFEKPAFLPERLPAVFHLKAVEKLDDDGLWLRYTKV